MKKTLTMILCCILAFSSLVGCSDKAEKKEAKKSQATQSADGVTSSANYEVEYFDGKEDGVVATVNGEDITVDEYNYFLMMAMYTEVMNAGDEVAEDFWTQDKIDTVLESAMNQAVLTHVYHISAVDNGIEMPQEEIDNIDANISSGVAYYGSEENFDMYFESQALTRELFRDISIRSYYASKLFEKYVDEAVSDEDVVEKFNNEYVKAKHILIQKTNEEGTDVSAEALTKAEDLKAQLDGGADFDALMQEHNEDPGMASEPDGYVFTKGEMVAEFEEAAFALEPGQISDVVETTYGYHIIKKEVLEESELDKEKTDAYGSVTTLRSTIKSALGSESFTQYLEDEKAKVKVKINNKEYGKFADGTEKRYSDFMTKMEELSAKLNEIMSAASGVTEEVTEPSEEVTE